MMQVAASWGSMLEEHAVLGQHEALLSVIQTLAGLSDYSPILDLGCGTGAWLKRLYDAGYRNLYGIDQDSEAFGAANVAKFVAADLDTLDCADHTGEGHFGLVTIIEVIEHVANPQHLVELAVRALAPDGWLLITSPNIYSVRARAKFLVRPGMPYFEKKANAASANPDHIHPVVLEAYERKIFRPLNLSIARVWTYPVIGSQGSRWFARVAARVLRFVLSDNLSGDSLCLLLRKCTNEN
jgi:SAM-dependent methyltransferase